MSMEVTPGDVAFVNCGKSSIVISPYFFFSSWDAGFPCPRLLKMDRIGYEQDAMRSSLSFSGGSAFASAFAPVGAPARQAVMPAPAVLRKSRLSKLMSLYSPPFAGSVNEIPWQNAPVRKGVPIAAVVAIAGISVWSLRGSRDAAPKAPASVVSASPAPDLVRRKAAISYVDARPALEAHRDQLPDGLKGKTPVELEAAWPGWASRHDADIRARLAQGDEDSVVNLWLYGTTFTTLPRATEQEMASLKTRADAEDLLVRRLDDLVAGIASPGANERLQFARQLVERQGIDPATDAGKDGARGYLVKVRERVIAELARYRRAAASARRPGGRGAELTAYSTMYRDRGLSSDTRLTADFALDKALEAMAARGLAPHSVRLVAIVGPCLDFTYKDEWYDFYSPLTNQPVTIIDSLY